MLLKKLIGSSAAKAQRHIDQKAELYRAYIRREARVGGSLFGAVPAGRRREFFCLDEHTWIWHEEWMENGVQKTITTRYDIRPDGILKAQDGQSYQKVGRAEAERLYKAAQMYEKRVSSEIYAAVS